MKDSIQSMLLFSVQKIVCALPLNHVVEVMRKLSFETFSDLPPFISGVSVVRGAALPVLSLNTLLGYEEKNSHTQRFVVVRGEKNLVACLVDEVLGVESVDLSLLQLAPNVFGKAHSDLIQSVGTVDDKLLIVLRSVINLPEEFRKQLLEFKSGAKPK